MGITSQFIEYNCISVPRKVSLLTFCRANVSQFMFLKKGCAFTCTKHMMISVNTIIHTITFKNDNYFKVKTQLGLT